MSRSQSIASWLLECAGVDGALAGDLLEERTRRSPAWYWRQVFIAIWSATWRAIGNHKLLAIRAVATGCAANLAWTLLLRRFPGPFRSAIPSLRSLAATSAIILLTQIVTGWIIARTHRAHALPMVSVFALWLVLWYFAGTIPDARRLLVNSLDQPRFRPYLAQYLSVIGTEVFGLLVGAFLAALPRRQISAG